MYGDYPFSPLLSSPLDPLNCGITCFLLCVGVVLSGDVFFDDVLSQMLAGSWPETYQW